MRNELVMAAAFMIATSAWAQLGASGAAPSAILPKWDVVSVKQADPEKCSQGSGIRMTPDGMSVFCVALLLPIERAYGIMEANRILGMPEWVKSGPRWDIEAKVAGEDAASYGRLSHDERSHMIQALLAERFHMKAHVEKREIPVYEMVVAKGGPKLKQSADEAGKGFIGMHGPGEIESTNALLANLPDVLSYEVGRPVIDETGVTGRYDFTLKYVTTTQAASDESGGPSIFTALEEQLGLKLEPAKKMMDVLVIDAIEQPAGN